MLSWKNIKTFDSLAEGPVISLYYNHHYKKISALYQRGWFALINVKNSDITLETTISNPLKLYSRIRPYNDHFLFLCTLQWEFEILSIRSKSIIMTLSIHNSLNSFQSIYFHELTPLSDGSLIFTTSYEEGVYILKPNKCLKRGYQIFKSDLELSYQFDGYPHNGFIQLRDGRFVSGTESGTIKIFKKFN